MNLKFNYQALTDMMIRKEILKSISAILLTIGLTNGCTPKEYSTAEKIISQKWENYSDNTWKLMRIIDYEYDENGNLTLEKWRDFKDDSVVMRMEVIRTYNNQNLITKMTRLKLDSGKWKKVINSSFEYEEDKVIIRKDTSFMEPMAKGVLVKYNYEEDLVVKEITSQSLGETTNEIRRTLYKYNDQGQPILKNFQVKVEDDWSNSRKMELFYDKSGNHISTKRYNWKDSLWSLNIHYNLEVNENGIRLFEDWKRLNSQAELESFMRVTNTVQ
jgi:hypothetical protein